MSKTIVVLEGDETGQELLLEALRVLDPSVTGLDIEFTHFDLTLENRRATGNDVVLEAAAAMRKTGLGLKAATITPPDSDDVGSPNRILREEIGAEVILRTGRRIPGVRPIAGVYSPISVVRMAIYESTLETVYDDIRTSDLGGSAATTEFTDEVIRRVKSKLPSGPPWGSQRAVACSQLFGGSALEAYSNDH